jgi:hypothetical protein
MDGKDWKTREYPFMTVVAYAWLFVSCVAGLVTLVQYLYNHLQWIS